MKPATSPSVSQCESLGKSIITIWCQISPAEGEYFECPVRVHILYVAAQEEHYIFHLVVELNKAVSNIS